MGCAPILTKCVISKRLPSLSDFTAERAAIVNAQMPLSLFLVIGLAHFIQQLSPYCTGNLSLACMVILLEQECLFLLDSWTLQNFG